MKGNFIDMITGEIYEDSNLYTAADMERARRNREHSLQEIIRKNTWRRVNDDYGVFVRLLYTPTQTLGLDMKPESLTKLIYLSTFITYDGYLVNSRNMRMDQKAMMKVLNVSERTYKDFISDIKGKNILLFDDKKNAYINTDILFKGKCKMKPDNVDKSITRLYVVGVRDLYEKSSVTNHRLLSYLYQAIPYVNLDYNILCENPYEKDLGSVKSMQFVDFCEKIGYDPHNYVRLKNTMKKLFIRNKPVFNFVDNGFGLFCYINPHIYYAGNKHDEVEVLGNFKDN